MNDAPEKIWLGCQVGKSLEIDCWSTTDTPDDGLEWQNIAEYRRADLPAKPAQIAASPEVRALVEAAKALGRWCVANLPSPAAHEELKTLDDALGPLDATTRADNGAAE